MLGKNIYVPTFTLSEINLSGIEDVCNASKSGVSGYSRLYSLDYRNGSGAFKGLDDSKRRFIQVEGVKITGVTHLRNNDGGSTVVFTYDMLSKNPFEDQNFSKLAAKNGITSLKDGSFALHVDKAHNSVLPPGSTIIYYWIEK